MNMSRLFLYFGFDDPVLISFCLETFLAYSQVVKLV